MTLFAGIDGGGTRTRAVIVDASGVEVARGEAPGAVATAHDPEPAAEAVRRAIGDALEAAALELLTRDAGLGTIELPLSGLWAGLAGAGSTEASRAVAEALSRRGLAQKLTVGTDVRAAFQDAFPDGDGILLIAGTGSIAWGAGKDGVPVQVGGWGQHLGDEGSGYWIGLHALRQIMRAHDGRDPEGRMTPALLAAMGLDSPEGVVGWIGDAEKGTIAALAPEVFSAAEQGDNAAETILAQAVDGLVELVAGVAARTDSAPASVPVVLWGGLIAGDGPLGGRVRAELEAAGYEVARKVVDPAMGAARLARQL